MDSLLTYLLIAVGILLVAAVAVVGLVRGRSRRAAPPAPPRPGIDYAPGVGDDATTPRDTPRRTIDDVGLPGTGTAVLEPPAEVVEEAPALEVPEPSAGRLARLRARLARSNSAIGKGLLALLSRGQLDDDTWDEVEETLLVADLGVAPDPGTRRAAQDAGEGRGNP